MRVGIECKCSSIETYLEYYIECKPYDRFHNNWRLDGSALCVCVCVCATDNNMEGGE